MGTSFIMKYLVTLALAICLVTQVYSNPLENKSEVLKKCEETCNQPSIIGIFSIFNDPKDFVMINGVISEEFKNKTLADVLTKDAHSETGDSTMASWCKMVEGNWSEEVVEPNPELKFARFKD